MAALAAALASAAARRATAPALAGLPSGWRNVPAFPQLTRYFDGNGQEIEVRYRLDRTVGSPMVDGPGRRARPPAWSRPPRTGWC